MKRYLYFFVIVHFGCLLFVSDSYCMRRSGVDEEDIGSQLRVSAVRRDIKEVERLVNIGADVKIRIHWDEKVYCTVRELLHLAGEAGVRQFSQNGLKSDDFGGVYLWGTWILSG
ncbi:MAG: hypothetical protein HOI80_03050 [Alphaproteobacteria bacterium]|nr:hypothetical protein [Alphaproteobacteria bacterium]MBT5389142.1 hypothetical protein [Alphaproteobacteria bacterium]MBT5654461.1 hypothetical protein [Alphaproteobacteria bacterium]